MLKDKRRHSDMHPAWSRGRERSFYKWVMYVLTLWASLPQLTSLALWTVSLEKYLETWRPGPLNRHQLGLRSFRAC